MKIKSFSSDAPRIKGPLSRKRLALFLGLMIAVAAMVVTLGVWRLGHWLMVQDPLQNASAIIVIGGQVPFRAMEAAAIYRKGWAHAVWVTRRTVEPADLTMSQLGIETPSEDRYSQQVLERLGVPPEAIRRLDPRVRNTAEEVRAIAEELQREQQGRVILVTSKYHACRLRVLWHLLIGDHPQAIVRYTPYDPFQPDGWWRNSGDAMAASREFFGLLNSWAGFPVK